MKTLNLNQMEQIEGGEFDCSAEAQKKYSTIGLVTGILSFFGPIGAITFGPTAIAMSAASTYCAYQQEELQTVSY